MPLSVCEAIKIVLREQAVFLRHQYMPTSKMNKLMLSIVFLVIFDFVVCQHRNETDKDVGPRYGFGERIRLDEFPFFGYFSIFPSPDKPPLCSGSVIHPRWVLTSARCIKNITRYKSNVIFTTGKVDSSFSSQKNYWDHYYPNVLIAHEDFKVVPGKGEHSVHDIGLAKLMDRLRFSRSVQPIDLANDDEYEDYTYQFATFVEWASYPDETLIIPMQIASANLCILGQHECVAKTLNMIIDSKLHVCGFDNDEHVRACKSDDGAPLVLDKKLIGVATVTTPGCVTEWRPTVFTKVSTHLPWIRENLGRYSDYI